MASSDLSVEPYGSWDSKVTPGLFSQCNCKAICELHANDDAVFWVEQNATTGKRELYSQAHEGERERWANGLSVQTSVHEYGGGASHLLKDGSVVFSTPEGLFLQKSPKDEPRLLSESDNGKLRYADFTESTTHIFCVGEIHEAEGDPTNCIFSIDKTSKKRQIAVSGADFYACPRISPDESRLVYMQWNHPNMPWDETSICVAELLPHGVAANATTICDGTGKNINYMYPNWKSPTSIYVVHDKTNFWNLYEVDVESIKEINLLPVLEEIGTPLWQFCNAPYSASNESVLINVNNKLVHMIGRQSKYIEVPDYLHFSHIALSPSERFGYAIGSGPNRASAVVRVNLDESSGEKVTVIRESRSVQQVDSLGISKPTVLSFDSDGVTVSGYFYPPYNDRFEAPKGTLPPVILMGHGGPTARTDPVLDLKKQFFTSRGFAVFDVNYRGSTGYGTDYRNMLKRNCGVVDRDDLINAARFLIEQKMVDPEMVTIMGTSSGGYLLLSCLIHSDIIKAAVSHYGVADLLALDEDTHKLEKSYNISLVGKFPEEKHIYDERNPTNHLDKIKTPIAFLHGDKDFVVPISQSVLMYEELEKRGVMTALMIFEGEGHGFRGEKAIRESIEASYYFLATALGIKPSIKSTLKIVNNVQSNL